MQFLIFLSIKAETGTVKIFTHKGPVKSGDFLANDIVPMQVPECTWNKTETAETLPSKRGRMCFRDVKVSNG